MTQLRHQLKSLTVVF